MLLLVFANGHFVGFVDEDVGRHENGIGVEANRRSFLVLARLLFELGHAVQPADAARAAEYPGQFRVLSHLALVEDDALLRVEPAGEVGRRHVHDRPAEFGGVLPDGDRMHVDHAVDALMRVLHVDPVQHGAEVIAEMQVTGRLHAGKHARDELGHQEPSPSEAGCLCPQSTALKRASHMACLPGHCTV